MQSIVCPRIEREVFFSWFSPLLYLHRDGTSNKVNNNSGGDSEPLRRNYEDTSIDIDDIPRLPAYLTSSECRRRLETVIGKRREKQLVKSGGSELASVISSSRTRNWLKSNSSQNSNSASSNNSNGESSKSECDDIEVSSTPLLKAILLRHGGTLFKISLLKIVNCGLSFLSPLLLGQFVSYLEKGVSPSNLRIGFGLAFLLACSAFCSAVVNTNSNARCLELKLKLQAALTQLVFARSISLPSIAWSDLQFNEAQVNNFIQVDVDQVSSCLQNMNDLWLLPAQIIIAFVLLYLQIKIAFLAGVAVILVMIPLNSWIATAIGRSTESLMKNKDSRVKIMTEALKAINSVKMSGLEDIVLKTANKFREEELKYLSRRKYLDSLCVFLWAATPILVPYATFITAVYVMNNDSLSPSKIITTIALLNMLIFPMNAFPWVINGFVEARVSIRRLGKLLNSSDNSYLVIPDFRGDALAAKEAIDIRRSQRISWQPSDHISCGPSQHRRSISLVKAGYRYRWKRPEFFGFESSRSSSSSTAKSIRRSASTSIVDHNSIFSLELNADLNCHVVVDDANSNGTPRSPIEGDIKGDMWIITGATGSGKTTLLAAILQELFEEKVGIDLPNGRESFQTDWNNSITNHQAIQLMGQEQQSLLIASDYGGVENLPVCNNLGAPLYCESIPGGISYCSQVPVLFSGTIRSNILVGQDLDEDKYHNILEGCALLPDLQSVWKENGDLTDVGNMGSNVSGGQRLRIGLARALYACSGVILLDDPISALDSETAKQIIRYLSVNIVGRDRRTVVMTTHAVAFVDRVVKGMQQDISGILILQEGKEVGRGGSLSTLLGTNHLDEYLQRLLLLEEDQFQQNDNNTVNSNFIFEDKKCIDKSLLPKAVENKTDELVEDRMSGAISKRVYWQFIQSLGIISAVMTVLSTVCMQFSSIAMSLFLGYWAGHLSEYSDHRFMEITTTIMLLNVFFTVIRSFLFAFSSLRSCRLLYERLSCTVMNTSLSFFEQTSIGSIINRFGKDTNTIDDSLPFILNILLAQAVLLLGSFLMMAYTNPMIVILIIIIAIGYYRLQKFYRYTSRELRRLESVYRSPVYTLFTEHVTASTIMRAFHTCRSSSNPQSSPGQAPITGRQWRLFDEVENEEDELALHSVMYAAVRQLNKAQDKFIRASIAVNVASQWLGIRMQLLGVLITTVLSISIILNNCYSIVPISASLAGLSLIYSYSIVNNLNGFINALAETEQEMISVERVLDYVNGLPSEYSVLDHVLDEEKHDKSHSRGCCSCSNCLFCCKKKRNNFVKREYEELLGKDGSDDEEVDLEGGMSRGGLSNNITEKLIIDDEASAPQFPLDNDITFTPINVKMISSVSLSFFSSTRGIHLENVWMKYCDPNSEAATSIIRHKDNDTSSIYVLKGISLTIPSGSRVVIVGRTGSGKTSLLRCLLRINEHDQRRGSISFGQVDLMHISKRKLRKSIGIIPQQPVLFSGTLRFNIDPYNEHSDDEIMFALHQSSFLRTLATNGDNDETSDRFKGGRLSSEKVWTSDVLDSMIIQNGGENFSYGQRQLLCLCRALLRRCDLFLVDEVSASLDNQTRDTVYGALDQHLKRYPHSILLMVSHQLDQLQPLCNKVRNFDCQSYSMFIVIFS